MSDLPVYTDGCFGLYRIRTDESKDYPEEYLEDQNMEIWYKEISVFDHMKYDLGQGGIEVTMKIRIPQHERLIDSKCVCLIDGQQHRVYNATNITNKDGYRETELTLVRPEKEIEEIR
ncbi:hypothetical protein [[Clostridium] scindens]|uniref:hypothetical protein n=1 Tax=Clostridium scindens (strain JCM 10418 / VPI 12708) TaxID=29347 RepID=UPI00242B189C|nr:hypothetical protein [[Clostridium] scindens]